MTDVTTLRKDIGHYVDAGMNHFTLGHNVPDEGALKDVEVVMREIGGSLK